MPRAAAPFLCLSIWLATSVAGQAAEPLKLYEFDCGRITLATLDGFGVDDSESDVRELIVPCYVIRHPDGDLLFDGGVMSSFAGSPGDYYGMDVRLARPFSDRLADIGLDMTDFEYVAFSHMHWDHIGVANEVGAGTWLVQRAEFEGAFPESGDPTPGFQPGLYASLADLPRRIVDGDHDVFGDGRVRLLSTPGHTPGHQSLYVELAETGAVILSGDLYHTRISFEQRRVPDFNIDREATLSSMDVIDALIEQTGAILWIEHELARFERSRHAPQYYE
jgi:glyoxylase-like metal-dependent hydrolase (beta-lactamase superfamily II)